MLGLFKMWRFSVQIIYSGFKVIETGIFLTEISDYFSEILWLLYGLVHKFDTYVSHMLNDLFTDCDIWLVSSCFRKSWRVPHVGQEMLTLSGTPDFTPLGKFIILLIHYTYKLCITEFVSLRTMFTD